MADSPNRKVQTNFQPCIIVHGGAWAILDVLKDPSVKGVKKAAEIGYESLITVKVLSFLPQWSPRGGVLPNMGCKGMGVPKGTVFQPFWP